MQALTINPRFRLYAKLSTETVKSHACARYTDSLNALFKKEKKITKSKHYPISTYPCRRTQLVSKSLHLSPEGFHVSFYYKLTTAHDAGFGVLNAAYVTSVSK